MDSPIIHIGLPKSGSTLLQQEVFPHLNDRFYVGKRYDEVPWRREATQRFFQISSLEELRYQGVESEVQGWVTSIPSAGKPLLVSDEWFSIGSSWQRSFPQDRMVVARRLVHLFPDAKVVMIIREQLAWLRSFFFEIQRNPFNAFTGDMGFMLRIERDFHEKRGVGYFLPGGEYDALFEIYRHLFGEARVKVLLFERLLRQPEATLVELLEFMDSSTTDAGRFRELPRVNTRTRKGELALKALDKRFRFLSRFFPSSVRRAARRLSQSSLSGFPDYEYTKEESVWLTDYYRPGNARLAEWTGLDLASEGYSA